MQNRLAARLKQRARSGLVESPPSSMEIVSPRLQPARAGQIEGIGAATAETVSGSLVSSGRLDTLDRERAVELAKSTENPLPIVLDRLGLVSQIDWAEETARLSGLALLRLDEFPANLPVHPRLSGHFLRSRHVLPIELDETRCRIAVADPADAFVRKALGVALGMPIVWVVSPYRDIEAALVRAEQEGQSIGRDRGRDQQDADYLVELANDAPTIKLVDRIFASALEREATDIHLEVFDRSTRLRYRIDGMLVEQPPVPADLYAGVVSRLKILAGLDIAERRLPQDGRIRHRSHGREFDLRVATAPAIHGETMALRILDHQSGHKQLSDLEMPDRVHRLFRWGLEQRNGLILVTGPTGSGKTTTLHAALTQLNTVGRKIVSVENPVEIQVPGVIQVESNSDIGLDFARTLRAFLRHDPDVMMVGEIRDRETAEVAIQAALTGHLVLSTLHTNDAPSAVTRLQDMGIDRFLIDATLRVSAAQRLVRTLCRDCARPSSSRDLGARVVAALPDAVQKSIACTPHEPVGCARCNGTGFRGRRAVFEAIEGSAQERNGEASAYQPMREHALRLVATGVTSAEEAMRVIDIPETTAAA